MTLKPSLPSGIPSRLLSGGFAHLSGPQGHSFGSQQYCISLFKSAKPNKYRYLGGEAIIGETADEPVDAVDAAAHLAWSFWRRAGADGGDGRLVGSAADIDVCASANGQGQQAASAGSAHTTSERDADALLPI